MIQLTDVDKWQEILDEPLVISQKLDGAALIARFEDEQIKFFTKDKRREIDVIFQAVSNMFDEPIAYLTSKLQGILQFDQQEITFEYFSPNIEPIIPVITWPLHNLVLLRHNLTNFTSIRLAGALQVTPPPIIFAGKLDPYQKNVLLTGDMNLEILKILNPHFEPLINPKRIEGIVVKTAQGTFKLTTKLFRDLAKSKIAYAKLALSDYKKLLKKLVTGFQIIVPLNYDYSKEMYLEAVWKNLEEKSFGVIEQNKEIFSRYFEDGKWFQVTFSDFE